MSGTGKPIVILIAGGHACGKTEATNLLEKNLYKRFGGIKVKTIDLSTYEDKTLTIGDHRLSNPSRFDFDKVVNEVNSIGKSNQFDIIIINGLYALYDKQLLKLGTLKIFIDCDADVRIGRWIKRDILHGKIESENSRSNLQQLIALYLTHSKIEMNDFIFQTKQFADIILPRGLEAGSTGLIIDGIQPLISNNNYDLTPSSSEIILKRSSVNLNTGSKKRFYNLS